MKTTRKALAAMLALVMALSLAVVPAAAAEPVQPTVKIDLLGATTDQSGEGWTWVQTANTMTLTGSTIDCTGFDYGIRLPANATLVMGDGDGDGVTVMNYNMVGIAFSGGNSTIRPLLIEDESGDAHPSSNALGLNVYGGGKTMGSGNHAISSSCDTLTIQDIVFYLNGMVDEISPEAVDVAPASIEPDANAAENLNEARIDALEVVEGPGGGGMPQAATGITASGRVVLKNCVGELSGHNYYDPIVAGVGGYGLRATGDITITNSWLHAIGTDGAAMTGNAIAAMGPGNVTVTGSTIATDTGRAGITASTGTVTIDNASEIRTVRASTQGWFADPNDDRCKTVTEFYETEGWKWEKESKTLTLNGARLHDLTLPAGAQIILHGESTMTSRDSCGLYLTNGAQVQGEGSLDILARGECIFGAFTMASGTLNLRGGTGIIAYSETVGIPIKINGGSVSILAKKNGIFSNAPEAPVQIHGGTLTIRADGVGLYSKGPVVIANGSLDISGGVGMHLERNDLTVSGGTVKVVSAVPAKPGITILDGEMSVSGGHVSSKGSIGINIADTWEGMKYTPLHLAVTGGTVEATGTAAALFVTSSVHKAEENKLDAPLITTSGVAASAGALSHIREDEYAYIGEGERPDVVDDPSNTAKWAPINTRYDTFTDGTNTDTEKPFYWNDEGTNLIGAAKTMTFTPESSGGGSGGGPSGGGGAGGSGRPPVTPAPAVPSGEYLFDVVDPGEDVTLPTKKLDAVTSSDTAASAVSSAVSGMTKEQKTSATGADRVTLFAEEAVSRAASKKVTGAVSVNAAAVADLQKVAATTAAAVETALVSGGVTAARYLASTVRLTTDETGPVTITIDPDILKTEVDKVRVETPTYAITIKISEIAADLEAGKPITITAEDVGTGFAAGSKGKTTTVKLNLPNGKTANPLTLSLHQSEGDVTYQAVTSTEGKAAPSKQNPATGNMDAKIAESGTYTVKTNQKDFGDIAAKSAEMQKAIRYLASKGIIDGTTATTFSPDGTISRAEIAALIMRALGKLDSKAVSTFPDVKSSDWYYAAAGSSAKHGIINGLGDGRFAGTTVIAKDQIVAVASRVLRTEMNYKAPSDAKTYLAKYSDAVAPWAQSDVALASRENMVVQRVDGTFKGTGNITRGDAAIIISRLFNKIW